MVFSSVGVFASVAPQYGSAKSRRRPGGRFAYPLFILRILYGLPLYEFYCTDVSRGYKFFRPVGPK